MAWVSFYLRAMHRARFLACAMGEQGDYTSLRRIPSHCQPLTSYPFSIKHPHHRIGVWRIRLERFVCPAN